MPSSDNILKDQQCTPCSGNSAPIPAEHALSLLKSLHPDWQLNQDKTAIKRRFVFKGFMKTMGFMNAVAWIAIQQMHHPDCDIDESGSVGPFAVDCL